MMNMITPQFVYMIHKEKERDLERQIAWIHSAQAQRGAEPRRAVEPRRTWFAQAAQWMKVKLARPAHQPEPINKPCSGVPC